MKNIDVEKRRKIIRITTFIGIILTILLSIVVYNSNYFSTGGGFEELLEKSGILAGIIYIIVGALHTVYPIVPLGLINTVGGLVFGVVYGGIYNIIGTYIGSYLNFCLGRKYGKGLITSFISEELYQKYKEKIDNKEKFKKFLISGFLLPLFPDDIMCMVAGTSNLTKKEFMKIVIFARPLSIIMFTFVTSNGTLMILRMLGR